MTKCHISIIHNSNQHFVQIKVIPRGDAAWTGVPLASTLQSSPFLPAELKLRDLCLVLGPFDRFLFLLISSTMQLSQCSAASADIAVVVLVAGLGRRLPEAPTMMNMTRDSEKKPIAM